MISYAENREDAVLARLFDGTGGFYVDLGAGHPLHGSLTKHLALAGWRGLNVEALPEEVALLRADRPQDTCVHAAVTDRSGTAVLHVAPPGCRGRSTLVDELAGAIPTTRALDTIEVPTVRLADLLAEHGVVHIDLLTIDVEGSEAAVVGDTDWRAVRPRVIVIDATVPGEATPAHEAWEPALLAAGYVCTLFDGANRFYAAAGDHEAIAALSVPANARDDARPYLWSLHVRHLEERLRAETAARERAEARVGAIGGDLAAVAEAARRAARLADPAGHLLADPAETA